MCLIWFVFVLFEKNTENEVCVRERHFRWWARDREVATRTGVGGSCSPAVSDGKCEAACGACRVVRARHSSTNSEVVSCTGKRSRRCCCCCSSCCCCSGCCCSSCCCCCCTHPTETSKYSKTSRSRPPPSTAALRINQYVPPPRTQASPSLQTPLRARGGDMAAQVAQQR